MVAIQEGGKIPFDAFDSDPTTFAGQEEVLLAQPHETLTPPPSLVLTHKILTTQDGNALLMASFTQGHEATVGIFHYRTDGWAQRKIEHIKTGSSIAMHEHLGSVQAPYGFSVDLITTADVYRIIRRADIDTIIKTGHQSSQEYVHVVTLVNGVKVAWHYDVTPQGAATRQVVRASYLEFNPKHIYPIEKTAPEVVLNFTKDIREAMQQQVAGNSQKQPLFPS